MGDGTRENPFTREDVLKLIEENGETAIRLDLSNKVFEDAIDLRGLNLHDIILKNIWIRYAHFEDDDLRNVHLENASIIRSHFKRANLRGAHLNDATFLASHLEDSILSDSNLENASFHSSHLERANLFGSNLKGTDMSFAHLEGAYLYKTIITSDTKLENTYWGNYILGDEYSAYPEMTAQDTCRRLKQWYINAGISDIAAKFYYREKEAGRKAIKLRSKLWYHRLALEASHLVFGYGEGWKRILVWIAVVVFGLAAAYYFWGSFSSSSFWDTLYYSAASFTALGYGNWAPQPTGWAKGMGAVEAIIGVFMMALLLVTFVRKWTR